MYLNNFRRPISLVDWMQMKGFSQNKAAKFFGGFTPSAIDKMIKNPDREIGVWESDGRTQLVEVITVDNCVSVYCDGAHAQSNYVIYIKALQPKPKLGPASSGKKRGPAPRVQS